MASLDDKDLKLLQSLKENARASLVSLSRDIDLSKSATHDRIIKLEERGIIKGYTIDIDRQRLPAVRAFITLKFETDGEGSRLVKDIKKMPGVEAVHCLTGDIDTFVYCECESIQALADLRNELAALTSVIQITTRHILESQ